MKTKLLLFLIVSCQICKSQNVTEAWSAQLFPLPGKALFVTAEQLRVSGNGDVYAGGYFFVDTSTNLNTSMAVVKLNSAGIFQWIATPSGQQYDAVLRGLGLDSSENIFIAGTLDEGGGILQTAASYMYDLNGNEIWKNIFDTTGMGTRSHGNLTTNTNRHFELVNNSNITLREIDASGMIVNYFSNDTIQYPHAFNIFGFESDIQENLYVFGYYFDSLPASDTDYFIKKFSPSGALLWEKFHNHTTLQDQVEHACIDSSGNVYLTGTTNISSGSVWKCLTIAYDSTGAQKWLHEYEIYPNKSSIPGDIYADPSGNVYVSGYGGDSLNYAQIFLIKYNSSGAIIWQRFADSAAYLNIDSKIASDLQGNIYLTCNRFNSSLGFFPRTMKFDTSGTMLWSIDYFGNGGQAANSITVDPSANVYIAGNGFVVKYIQPTTINEFEIHQIDISVFPNPAIEEFKIHPGLAVTRFKVKEVELVNILGETVLKSEIKNPKSFGRHWLVEGDAEIIISVRTLPRGLYFYRVKDKEGGTVGGKIILQ